MSKFTAQVIWQRAQEVFTDGRYSRRHLMRFDGGIDVPASASPHVVPLPLSDASAVDPEEAFVAALASCHMLWFLSVAAKRKFRVDRYVDDASGIMQSGVNGKPFISKVSLQPKVNFSGECLPSNEDIEAMHHQAHEECFIANSVKTEVSCAPIF